MRAGLLQNQRLPPPLLGSLIVVLLALGIFFRFVNLDQKVYHHDEAYTSLRIAGYTRAEVVQRVFNGRVIDINDLQRYVRVNPEKGLIDTIHSLAIEDPHHTPLYYVLVRLWVTLFGNSVAVIRSFSALISLLVFPCLYWLCRELFESSSTSWIAMGLIAVSPFHVLYAQEAREYSLWTVTILLLSATLLRAMRLRTKASWSMYAVTVALGLYTHPFSLFVAIGHGLYVFAINSFRLSKAVIAYLFASLTGMLVFMPWLLVITANFSELRNATSPTTTDEKLSPFSLAKIWLINLSRFFVDLNPSVVLNTNTELDNPVTYFTNPLAYIFLPILIFLILSILILVIYSFYFLYRKAPKRVWLFILTLTGVTALVLMPLDLILGGARSAHTRYLTPSYLGIQLAVAYLLTTQITSLNVWSQKLWQVTTVVLISIGVLSCTISSQAETWWNKEDSEAHSTARTINQAANPLLISDTSASYAGTNGSNLGVIFSLSYLLDSKVRLQLVVIPDVPDVPNDFNNIFLYNPSKSLQQKLKKEQNYKLRSFPEHEELQWIEK